MAGGVSDLSQDVRVAVAMTGGVSLAVWMGGIAREVNLLQQASNVRSRDSAATEVQDVPGDGSRTDAVWDLQARELYLRLLDLMDATVTVDVLSGTSAGGINAAMLGLSSAAGVDLADLRDLWLTAGSMDVLLRDPGEKNPSALMQGDKVLYMQLDRAMQKLYRQRAFAPPPPVHVDTTVYITTTLLAGETSRFTDDYGTLVADVDHHGLFTFTQSALAPSDDASDSLTALALAARSSASFPAAFEPSFVPFNEDIPAGSGVPSRPDMSPFTNLTRSHWTADGGILANRPLAPLLNAVFARPASPEGREVRRVLAYIVPDGGGTADPQDVPNKDMWTKAPTMIAALKADLGAQLSQSIATDLEAIRKHNDRIKADHDLRRSLAEIGTRLPGHQLVTTRLLRDFERQQGRGLAAPLMDRLMRRLSTIDLPAEWAAEFAPGHRPVESQMAETMVRVLGVGWRNAPTEDSERQPGEGLDRAWSEWTAAADAYSRAARFGLPAFHAARSVAVRLIKLTNLQAVNADQRRRIADIRARLEKTFDAPETWNAEQDRIRLLVDGLVESAQGGGISLLQLARSLADARREQLRIADSPASDLEQGWENVASVVADLVALLHQPDATSRPPRLDAQDVLQVYVNYLDGSGDPAQVCDRLLNLVIAERALQPAEQTVDQPVEFIQVSANTRTLLAPTEGSVPASQQLDSVEKLRGVELHHFAAFYKSSWRAYDWMWGRLDGAGWLVHILLDPRRILAVVENVQPPIPHGERAKYFAARLRTGLDLPADVGPPELGATRRGSGARPVASRCSQTTAEPTTIGTTESLGHQDGQAQPGSRRPCREIRG